MSSNLPVGKTFFYGLFHGDNQIGFKCFANYTPTKPGQKPIYHANRLVIHPDYSGLGLGLWFSETTNDLFLEKMGSIRIMAKFSSVPLYRILMKSTKWKYLLTKRVMGSLPRGGTMDRKSGFREGGIKTFHFEYKG